MRMYVAYWLYHSRDGENYGMVYFTMLADWQLRFPPAITDCHWMIPGQEEDQDDTNRTSTGNQ